MKHHCHYSRRDPKAAPLFEAPKRRTLKVFGVKYGWINRFGDLEDGRFPALTVDRPADVSYKKVRKAVANEIRMITRTRAGHFYSECDVRWESVVDCATGLPIGEARLEDMRR